MNARQAAKAAAKRIEDLEDFNRRASGDIKALYACIDSVIAGNKSFCEWCEEFDECHEPEKVSGPVRGGAGCENFWMKLNHGIDATKGGDDDGKGTDTKGILGASGTC